MSNMEEQKVLGVYLTSLRDQLIMSQYYRQTKSTDTPHRRGHIPTYHSNYRKY